ncbi:hypothetical protein HPP92_021359 [Vanilla planifolia]|uniref:Uncharacterized protein n=1 Tax=Vanilla planifolia TaxID=51239 RepID=A0A835UGQ9_VANPL|nr:hypothetical protein HPP92_021359 [Vanilla planifolia]
MYPERKLLSLKGIKKVEMFELKVASTTLSILGNGRTPWVVEEVIDVFLVAMFGGKVYQEGSDGFGEGVNGGRQ